MFKGGATLSEPIIERCDAKKISAYFIHWLMVTAEQYQQLDVGPHYILKCVNEQLKANTHYLANSLRITLDCPRTRMKKIEVTAKQNNDSDANVVAIESNSQRP